MVVRHANFGRRRRGEFSTRYFPFVGPFSAASSILPVFDRARTSMPLGSIAMKQDRPLASGLPFSVTLPESLPRLGVPVPIAAGARNDDEQQKPRQRERLADGTPSVPATWPHQKSPSVSPAPMLLAATHVNRLMLLVMNRVLPSHIEALTPLGCRLRAAI